MHNEDEFDFGFSFSNELDELKETAKQSSDDVLIYKNKMTQMYKMIDVLLKNLSADPEKNTIYWPDRSEKISQFRQKLNEIIGEDY